MEELIQHLSNIPDGYDDFILGVINYAKKDPSHIKLLNEYMRHEKNLISSDVIEFIISQPDFRNYSAMNTIMHVG